LTLGKRLFWSRWRKLGKELLSERPMPETTTRQFPSWIAAIDCLLVPGCSEQDNRGGWQSMVSSRSDVKYREGYDPSDTYSNEPHVSPDLAPLEPFVEVRPDRGRTRRVGPPANRRSVGREVLRLFVHGLIIAAIGGAALASQYGDDNIKEALGSLQRSVGGLSPDLGANPSARVLEGFSTNSDQIAVPDKISAKEVRFIQPPPGSATAGSSPPIQQQLETVAGELAIVRGLVEQLTVSQKKMAQDVAALETAKDNLGQKTWWLSQSSAFDAPAQRSVKKTAPSTAKSSAVPMSSTRPQAP
jgi:hypothetical protein